MVTTSPSFSLYNIVVLPAASKPTKENYDTLPSQEATVIAHQHLK